jgi:chromosome partitioning protein
VGKTTTAVNLSGTLALAGKSVLLVDFDPQGNASSGIGFSRAHGGTSRQGSGGGILSETLAGRSCASLVQPTRFENLAAILSTPDLAELDVIQDVHGKAVLRLAKDLRGLARRYDVVVLDCPPSLGGLPTLALTCSDLVLVPVQCEYYAMEGLSQILPLVSELQNSTNRELRILGFLLTMFSDELELSHEVVAEVRRYFKDLVFRTTIPRDVALPESASHGLPVFHYDPISRGAWSYAELAKEVLRHDWT